MGDLFSTPRPKPPPAPPSNDPELCQRRRANREVCGSRGLGNVCFLSDDHMHGYCLEQARAQMKALANHLRALSPEERRIRLDKMRKHRSEKTIAWLERKSEVSP
jgi:hypothetical protein